MFFVLTIRKYSDIIISIIKSCDEDVRVAEYSESRRQVKADIQAVRLPSLLSREREAKGGAKSFVRNSLRDAALRQKELTDSESGDFIAI